MSTPSRPGPDATPADVVKYVAELHECVDRNHKETKTLNIATLLSIAGLLITVLGAGVKTVSWMGHIDGRLDNVAASVTSHDGRFQAIEARLNEITAALFGAGARK